MVEEGKATACDRELAAVVRPEGVEGGDACFGGVGD